MNNQTQGEPRTRDPIHDIVRFVRLANGSDGVAKVMLLETAMQLIERHYDISLNEVSGSPANDIEDCFVEDIRTGGIISNSIELAEKMVGNGNCVSGISKPHDFEHHEPIALYALWNKQDQPEISYIMFQHIYNFIQENRNHSKVIKNHKPGVYSAS